MKVALAQVDVTVGDLAGNRERIVAAWQRARSQGADLVVTPELSVCGYPPLDLLHDGAFVAACEASVAKLAEATRAGPPLVVGYPEASAGARPFNSAAVLEGGRVAATARKRLLPTYDVFDEHRYFTPSGAVAPVPVAGRPVGLHVCEDMWDEGYGARPCRDLAAAGARLLVNASASPFHVGKAAQRIDVARRHVVATGLPLLYANLVGGQDELVFDGRSFVLDATGRLVALATAFEEDLLLVDADALARLPEAPPPRAPRAEELRAALVLGVRDYFRKLRIEGAVVGLSGGIDSALVAAIAAEALGPRKVVGVSMPSKWSSDHSLSDAKALADALGIEHHVLPIQDSVDLAVARFERAFGAHKNATSRENLQARERGKVLMEIANDRGALVLSTGNKTELALGYCTLYGDMCGGLSVIADLSKTDVYAVARHINARAGREIVPRGSLEKRPSAELAPGQFDPFDYDVVSPLVDAIVEESAGRDELVRRGYPPTTVDDALRRYRNAEFKRRQAAIGIKVTPRAFGLGRRMPIVNGWRPS